ncbi:cytochrome P450 [Streptomyces sp. NPDC001401]|uniref:cytochrome P450 n=1 Tax=Streptomyces sp. NPDC001401 TaxID=3364570 RepID=UPI0036988657
MAVGRRPTGSGRSAPPPRRFARGAAETPAGTGPARTTALCNTAVANRDATVFDAPGEMRLDRSPNPRLAFGAGAHVCPGQELARAELQTVLHVLVRRLPSLELAAPAADLRRLEGLAVGGLGEVPVRW